MNTKQHLQQLENQLNEEYKDIGTITIKGMYEDNISCNDIEYVHSIMGQIESLDIDSPIIVSKQRWGRKGYILIDGYHRLKNKLEKGIDTTNVIVLTDYTITRTYDTLLDFLMNLVGEKIKFINSHILLVDTRYYQIEENSGCGGCNNGHSSIEVLPGFINKEILVKTIESKDEKNDLYNLYINNQLVANIDTGWGNGYYGGDFVIHLIS